MATGLGDFKNWSPIISKIIWPIFIVIILIVFSGEVSKRYNLVLEEVIEKGRSLEVGSFFKLGESARETPVAKLAQKDLPIEAIGGGQESGVIEKASIELLYTLKNNLSSSPLQKMDVLLVTDAKIYSNDALEKYIASLGVRFILFQKLGKFDGWIDSGKFAGQLRAGIFARELLPKQIYSYTELKLIIAGISKEYIKATDTAFQVLKKMQSLHVDNLPVIDANKNFMFFINRGEILSTLMTTIILEEQPNQFLH